MTAEYAEFHNSQLRASWRQRLTGQVHSWQHRAIEAIGLSSTIGVAIGGTIATVAGAAAGLESQSRRMSRVQSQPLCGFTRCGSARFCGLQQESQLEKNSTLNREPG